MKGMFRAFSIISLVIMIVAGWAMFAHHRSILVGSVKAVAEAGSLTTGRMALQPIRRELTDYVAAANRAADSSSGAPLPAALQLAIADLVRDSRVVRVKIYNRNGVVIFSTRREQIGGRQEANPGFATAMTGKVSVQLIYRDTFNTFDQETEEDNLVQTYFPVRGLPGTPVVGVFEIYTDVNALVIETERSEVAMLIGTLVMIACIYGALVFLAYRASGKIEAQQRIISEKNALLERLSVQSLRREEAERRKFAAEVHEQLAQSLSAIKLALESVGEGGTQGQGAGLSAIIPHLQSAIGHARSIAESLHPLDLDEFGLGRALDRMLREFASQHPLTSIEQEIAVDEAAVPSDMKSTVYRVVAGVLDIVRRHPEVKRLRISAHTGEDELVLLVEDDARLLAQVAQVGGVAVNPPTELNDVGERVIVSSGRLSLVTGADGAPALRAAWAL